MAQAATDLPRTNALYTPDQFERRQKSVWTTVQAVLAPLQFVVFLASVFLVVRYLVFGIGYDVATISILLKTGCLYLIMITGAIWEKQVFGQYLFAPAFFWEDVFSFVVIALHSLYIVLLWQGQSTPDTLMWIALAAYATYVVNAGQFLWKLRLARLDREKHS